LIFCFFSIKRKERAVRRLAEARKREGKEKPRAYGAIAKALRFSSDSYRIKLGMTDRGMGITLEEEIGK